MCHLGPWEWREQINNPMLQFSSSAAAVVFSFNTYYNFFTKTNLLVMIVVVKELYCSTSDWIMCKF